MNTKDGRTIPKFYESGYRTWEGSDDEFFSRIKTIQIQLEHLRSKKEKQMNDNTINAETEVAQIIPFAEVTDIRIIEGNDTDGETKVIEVAPDTVDIPVDVTVH